jgi:hypothetical protein
MSTGWTWDYCRDHIDLPRLAALKSYWDHHPPLHILTRMIAQSLGAEFKATAKPVSTDPALADSNRDIAAELSNEVPGGISERPYVAPRRGLQL